MGQTQTRGKQGEDAAVALLQQRGFQVLGRNLRTPYGEIDILTQEGKTLVFVEVKLRSSAQFGHPEDAVIGKKLTRLQKSIEHYVSEHQWKGDYRLDLVLIEGSAHNQQCTLVQDVG